MAQLVDVVVRHQIDLVQYSNGVVRRIIAILNRADAELFAQLTAALDALSPESYTVERLEAMLAGVRMLNADAYARAMGELEGAARELAGEEAGWMQSLYRTAAPAVNFASVTAEQAYVAAMARPFQGRLLREWAASIPADRMTRIRDAVRMGYLEGQTVSQVARRIRGTRALGYADGIIEIDRRHAETIARSALSHTAGVARDRFYEANADLLGEVRWISTLDSKTSEMCLIRDGLHYRVARDGRYRPVGHSIPWGSGPGRLHFNAIPAGSMIRTSDGDVPIETVSVGDMVLTHMGRFQPVTDTHSKRNDIGVLRVVHLESGRILRATHDHPVLMSDGTWRFVGALKAGDELLGDFEEPSEVPRIAGKVVSKPEDRPSVSHERGVALDRTLKLVASVVGLESASEIGPREVEDEVVEMVLRHPSVIESQSLLHHLLALAELLGEFDCKRLGQLLSSLIVKRDTSEPVAHSLPEAGRFLGGERLGNDLGIPGRIVGEHPLGVSGVDGAVLLGQSERPVIGAGLRRPSAGAEIDASLLDLGADRESHDAGVARQRSVREAVAAFNGSHGEAHLDVINQDEPAVVRKRFRHDKVSALEVSEYNSTVYDLGVREDASYLCNRIVVSNCRSTSIALLDGQEELYGTRASVQYKDGEQPRGAQVPANETYGQWLRRQPAGVQDQVLGATRGALFRRGGLDVRDFANAKGIWIDLDELRRRNAAAFERAGV